MYKVIYIDQVIHSPNTLTQHKDGNNYFTYGWSGKCARKFKEFNPVILVECWKVDSHAKEVQEKEISGVRFIILPGFSIPKLGVFSPVLMKRLKKEVATGKKIVVNLASIRHLLFYTVALLLRNIPLVIQHHGEATALYKSRISKGITRLFYLSQLSIERKAFRNVDLIYVIDDDLRNYLPADPAKTIIKLQTVGVETGSFPVIDREEAKRLLHLDPEKKYILYIGRLNFAKGFDILLRIYEEIKKERNDIRLLVAGTSKDDPLYRESENAGVLIHGTILHTEIFKFLTAASAYVLPGYMKNDPFGGIGLLPTESLLCNTPVIGGSLKNFPAEKRDLVGFALTDPARIKDAILKIVDRKVSFVNLREPAIQYYSWESIIRMTSADYSIILNNYKKLPA